MSFFVLITLLLFYLHSQYPQVAAAPVGVCYGRAATNLPRPQDVIRLLRSNGITRVRLYNPDPAALSPFRGTNIHLIVGVPDEILPTLANSSAAAAASWLQSSILSVVEPRQVRYLAVGNEVLLRKPFYASFVVPAVVKLHAALQQLGLDRSIKLSSPQATPILTTTFPPSAAAFDASLTPALVPLLQFLRDTAAPLMVNIYPFYSHVNNPQSVTLDNALFRSPMMEVDRNLAYTNMFDATVDAFVYAMERAGFPDIPVVVTETGWPTGGGQAAGPDNAMAYNGNVVVRAMGNFGTPKRPGVGLEVFLFDLFDENGKSGGEYQKHFGIFGVNGSKNYEIRFD